MGVSQDLSGFVVDALNGDTLRGAIVKAGDVKLTSTDHKGYFLIRDITTPLTIEIRYAGYQNLKTFFRPGQDSSYVTYYLNPDAVLDEVVVSAGRFDQKRSELTVSMDILKPDLIQQKNTTQLDQIVTQVPGVTVQDGQASIRGGSGFSYGAGSRVLMLLDDMPMISGDAGDIKWAFLPIETVEQIEVIKGAASVLYGSGALNGIIHLRTRYARDKPFTQCSVFMGSYDAPRSTYKWWPGTSQFQRGFTLTHIQRIKNSDFSFSGQYFYDAGYRLFEFEERGRVNVSWRYTSKHIKGLSHKISGAVLQNKGGIFYLWQHYDSAYIPQNRTLQAFYSINANLDNVTEYLISAHHIKLSLRNRYYYTSNLSSASHLDYYELQFQKQWHSKWVFNSGAILMQNRTQSLSLYGNHLGKQFAFYNQMDASPLNRLHVTAGLRLEYATLDSVSTEHHWFGQARPIVPVLRLGTNYQLWNGAHARASYGQGYRFPSTAEKFVNTGISVLKIFPNPNLQAERGENMELGIKQGFAFGTIKGQLDLAAFWTRYSNMIEFVFNYYNTNPNLPLNEKLNYYGFRSENLGKSDIKGIEASASWVYQNGNWNIQTMGGYTFINPIKPDFNPVSDTLGLAPPFLDEQLLNTLKYRSKHLFKWDLQIAYKKISCGWSSRYQSRILNIDNRFIKPVFYELGNGFEADDAPSILPGLKANWNAFSKAFWIHDFRCNVQLTPAWTLAYLISNVSNTEYQNRPGDMRAPRMHQIQITFKPVYKKTN